MSKLNIDQQTVYQLFSDKKSDFLIPDYQRPYAWGETECQTLWDDIFTFAFPDDDCDKFKKDDEYFLSGYTIHILLYAFRTFLSRIQLCLLQYSSAC